MAFGQELGNLLKIAESKGLTMSELGRRGARKANKVKREKSKYKRMASKYSDEDIQDMPWNK